MDIYNKEKIKHIYLFINNLIRPPRKQYALPERVEKTIFGKKYTI